MFKNIKFQFIVLIACYLMSCKYKHNEITNREYKFMIDSMFKARQSYTLNSVHSNVQVSLISNLENSYMMSGCRKFEYQSLLCKVIKSSNYNLTAINDSILIDFYSDCSYPNNQNSLYNLKIIYSVFPKFYLNRKNVVFVKGRFKCIN